jgi:CheY-like chemotaxis protein
MDTGDRIDRDARAAWNAGGIVIDSRPRWPYSSPLMDTVERASERPATDLATPRIARILVIDDDRHVRTLLCDLLDAWGYESDAAADGREGLRLFEPGRYDAVLTDLGMPGISGLDVLASVRDRDPGVVLIMFTAFTGDLDRERHRLGFTVLRKPLEIEQLRRAVRAAVDARGTMAG